MRLVCISDTHGFHREMLHPIPDGDVLVIAGDICKYGTLGEIRDFNQWLQGFTHPHKVVIAGNHDWPFQRTPGIARLEITNAIYLEDEAAVIEGVVFYGSPWTPWFHSWAFNQSRGPDSERKWASIPEDVEVLITHGPPKGILDKVDFVAAGVGNREYVGCGDLKRRLKDLSKLRVHIFGHIHGSYGTRKSGGKVFINASTCTEEYRPNNPPLIIDI